MRSYMPKWRRPCTAVGSITPTSFKWKKVFLRWKMRRPWAERSTRSIVSMKKPSEPNRDPALPDEPKREHPERVLILSADAGFGHKAAANAIAAAFQLHFPGRAE